MAASPDKIRFLCPFCDVRVAAPAERAGVRMRCPGCQSAVVVPSVSTPNIDGVSPQAKGIPERPRQEQIVATTPVGPNSRRAASPEPRTSAVVPRPDRNSFPQASAAAPEAEKKGAEKKPIPSARTFEEATNGSNQPVTESAEFRTATQGRFPRRSSSLDRRRRNSEAGAEAAIPEAAPRSEPTPVQDPPAPAVESSTATAPEPSGFSTESTESGLLLDDQWLLFYCPTCSELIKVDAENTETTVACAGCHQEFSLEIETD
ncbi:MAG: hypothetical protein AAGJ79_12495 [Verrucomicrobiota bacterium]